jgi:hypothetical protein
MKERIGSENPNLRICNQIVASRLPGTELTKITFAFLPAKIRSDIGARHNFGFAIKLDHPDQTTSFVAQDLGSEVIYLQDRNKQNKYLGEGQVFIENVEDELYIPVVSFSYTTKKFRRRGIGTRRLTVLNSVTRLLYEEPLYSSSTPRLAQRSVWENLVEQELAEIHEFKGVRRYKFV